MIEVLTGMIVGIAVALVLHTIFVEQARASLNKQKGSTIDPADCFSDEEMQEMANKRKGQ